MRLHELAVLGDGVGECGQVGTQIPDRQVALPQLARVVEPVGGVAEFTQQTGGGGQRFDLRLRAVEREAVDHLRSHQVECVSDAGRVNLFIIV